LAGYVHRDLAPTNFRVRADGSLILLDLELAHPLNSSEPPFTQGTPGFMSPEQQAGLPPDPAQDVFGVGALLAWFFTAIDPRRLLFGTERSRHEQLTLLGGIPNALAQIVARCLAKQPTHRPSVDEISEVLGSAQKAIATTTTFSRRPVPCRDRSRIQSTLTLINDYLPKIADGLLHSVVLDRETGLWLSPVIQGGIHEPADLTSNYTLHRSASRGVAGVIYTLARLMKFGFAGTDVRSYVERGGLVVDARCHA
jgi:serine/threonine protein kinase